MQNSVKYASEVDYRISSVRRIMHALSEEMHRVSQDAESSEESGDDFLPWDFAFDELEVLTGIAFVTAQTYITGTISDANHITRARKVSRLKKDELLKKFSDNVPNRQVTKLELCDAIANYFKHNDEWDGKAENERNRRTIETLREAGVIEEAWPCIAAAEILWSPKTFDLAPLASLLVNWRHKVIEYSKEAVH